MISENNIPVWLYQSIINSLPYGVLVADTSGRFILWNSLSRSLFSHTLVKSQQEKWKEDWGVYEPDQVTEVKAENIPLTRALKGETVTGVKLFLKNIGKAGMYVKVSAFPLYDEDGAIIAGFVVLEDVTEEHDIFTHIISGISDLEDYIKGNLGR